MKRSKFSEEQVDYDLRQVEAGTRIGDVCRQRLTDVVGRPIVIARGRGMTHRAGG